MFFTAHVVDNLGRTPVGTRIINSEHIKSVFPGRTRDDAPDWCQLTMIDGEQFGIRAPFTAMEDFLGSNRQLAD